MRVVHAFAVYAAQLEYFAHTEAHSGDGLDRELLQPVPQLMDFAIWAGSKAELNGIVASGVEAITALQYLTGQLHTSLSGDHVFEHEVMRDIEAEMPAMRTYFRPKTMDRRKQEMDVRNARRALSGHRRDAYLSAANSRCVGAAASMASDRDVVYIAAGSHGYGSALRYDRNTGLLDQLRLPGLTYEAVDEVRSKLSEIFAAAADKVTPAIVLERRLHSVLTRVGEIVMSEIVQAWPESARIAVVPLHRVIDLPLATALVGDRPAMLARDIITAPNARCLLLASLWESQTGSPLTAYVACDPSEGRDFIGAVVPEAERISEIYGVKARIFGTSNGRDESASGLDPTQRLRTRTWPPERHAAESNAVTPDLDELCGAAVVHLACHGFVEDDPFHGSVLELGRAIAMDDLLRHGVARGSVFVLSACYVGGVVPSYPSELLGFPASLISAGARNVLASLWPVPDSPSTIDFVARFHLDLRDGNSAAVAFRHAVQEAIASGVGPLTWGGFAVYGP
jgi:hypothetical protein